jgi:hypothetical protein
MQTLTLRVAKFAIVTTNKLLVATNVFTDMVAKRKVPVLTRNRKPPIMQRTASHFTE